MNRSDQAAVDLIDTRVEDALRYASAIGATLLVLLPAARGSSEMIGWLPLWLLAMPLSAWWVLRQVRRSTETPLQRGNTIHRRRPGARAENRRKRQGRSPWPAASARHG